MKPASSTVEVSTPDITLLIGLTLLLCCTSAAVLAGMPRTEDLLATAGSAGSRISQARAMHALSQRGYFEERPLGELREFLQGASQPAVDYVYRVQGTLLRRRQYRPGTTFKPKPTRRRDPAKDSSLD